MKRTYKIGFMVLFVAMANPAIAEDKNGKHALWKMSSSSESRDSTVFSGPRLNLPKIEAFQTAKEATGRVFDSAKKSTSRMWNSTVDFLNPWDNPQPKSMPKSKSNAWFFQKKEPEPEYSTVNDFLKLERPRF